jgi:hypothetical protein
VPFVWFALSFQEQVEKYGVYVGIASFFGLALLSVLYFSQARELKRLREWAGRAPERARDLEQRVVAQAAASVARRSPQLPVAPGKPAGAIAPARRLAEMPAPVAQQPAAGVAEQEQEADDAPATNGSAPKPAEVDAATAAGAVAAGAAAESADETPEDAEAPVAEAAAVNGAVPPAEQAAGDAAEAAVQPEEQEEPAEAPSAAQETREHAFDESGEHATDESDEHELDETGEHDLDTGEHEPESGEVPAAAVPRLTPAQRVGVTPRPAPLPLRQSQPSATPTGRRPAPATAPKEPGRRSAGTIVLLAGLAVLLLGGTAFGLSQVLGGDDGGPPPNNQAPPPTQTTEPGSAPAVSNEETTVGVLNGTTTNGLAATVADRLQQEAGYARGTTATNPDQTVQASTVYYTEGFRAQGRQIAELLSIDAVEPITDETAALAPDANVVVLAGSDQAAQ